MRGEHHQPAGPAVTAALCLGTRGWCLQSMSPRTPSRALPGLREPPPGFCSGGSPSSLETLGVHFSKIFFLHFIRNRGGLYKLELPYPSRVLREAGIAFSALGCARTAFVPFDPSCGAPAAWRRPSSAGRWGAYRRPGRARPCPQRGSVGSFGVCVSACGLRQARNPFPLSELTGASRPLGGL